MNRRYFLVTAGSASAAVTLPRPLFAATRRVAQVEVIRGPRTMLLGTPGRCASSRSTGILGFDRAALLETGGNRPRF